jgi:hypothetical protein
MITTTPTYGAVTTKHDDSPLHRTDAPMIKLSPGRPLRFLGSLVLLLSAAACVSSAKPTVDLPAGLSQPFALLKTTDFDSLRNAVIRYQRTCAKQQGFALGPGPIEDTTAGFILSPADFGYMSDDDARARGLHIGPLPITTAQPRLPEGANDALANCLQQANNLLGPAYQTLVDEYLDLHNQMTNDLSAKMESQITTADERVRRCVVSAGWHPLYPDKLGSESVSSAEMFGVALGSSEADARTGNLTYVPTPREIDLAMALQRCRSQLGTPQSLFAAAKQDQMPIVAKFEQQIMQINSDIVSVDRKALDVLV